MTGCGASSHMIASPVRSASPAPMAPAASASAGAADSAASVRPRADSSASLSGPLPAVAAVGLSQEMLHASEHLRDRRTKIVATLGPASVPKIRQLIKAGVNVFRLNFSHVSDPETQRPVIDSIRKESASLCLPVAILGDLCGPKIRCNTFSPTPSIQLVPKSIVRLVHSSEPGNENTITTSISEIVGVIQVGHRVLLNDGNLKLIVTERVSQDEVLCEVVVGGELKAKKGINVPDLLIALPALTDKDREDARFMYKMRLDYVALSFVKHGQDVRDLLDVFDELSQEESLAIKTDPTAPDLSGVPASDLEEDWRPHIIAKIETPHSLKNIDEIIHFADGIMVARGDLGVECSLEQVPLIQKTLIRKTNAADKPVITATQMLESMISAPVPTRAEVSDVANAVFDGTDAVMLSAECATGDFPVETVEMMASICQNAEAGARLLDKGKGFTVTMYKHDKDNEVFLGGSKHVSRFAHCIADAAVAAATEGSATAMLVFTTTSEMAIFCSKRRPRMPIIAITPTGSISRRLALHFGVHPMISSGLKISTPRGSVSLLRHENAEIPTVPQDHFNSDDGANEVGEGLATGSRSNSAGIVAPQLRNTDAILALTERDVINSAAAHIIGLKSGDTVCYCAGFHGPFPGLSNTIKMSQFGDSMRSERARMNWSQSIARLASQRK